MTSEEERISRAVLGVLESLESVVRAECERWRPGSTRGVLLAVLDEIAALKPEMEGNQQ